MSEGHVYVCEWTLLPTGRYRGTIAKPKLSVEVDNLDALGGELTNAIAEATGDCEPQIELEPPIAEPGAKPEWFLDGHVVLSAASHFAFDGVDDLVEGGFCDRCFWPLGGRTAAPLAVDSMWPGHASFSWDRGAEGVRVLLVSDPFLYLFSAEERETFALRPVILPKGKRKQYWEVVPHQFVPEVAIRSVEQSGWHCEACGRVQCGHGNTIGWGVAVVSRDAIPHAPIFFVGTSESYRLCMRGERWRSVKAAFRKAGTSSERVAVVRPDEVAEEFHVPEIDEIRRRNSQERP